nr:uncharacterized protein LOC129280961 [Lytechinus pictus]
MASKWTSRRNFLKLRADDLSHRITPQRRVPGRKAPLRTTHPKDKPTKTQLSQRTAPPDNSPEESSRQKSSTEDNSPQGQTHQDTTVPEDSSPPVKISGHFQGKPNTGQLPRRTTHPSPHEYNCPEDTSKTHLTISKDNSLEESSRQKSSTEDNSPQGQTHQDTTVPENSSPENLNTGQLPRRTTHPRGTPHEYNCPRGHLKDSFDHFQGKPEHRAAPTKDHSPREELLMNTTAPEDTSKTHLTISKGYGKPEHRAAPTKDHSPREELLMNTTAPEDTSKTHLTISKDNSLEESSRQKSSTEDNSPQGQTHQDTTVPEDSSPQ